MNRIQQDSRRVVRAGTQYPATIIDVHGDRASAQLSGNGAKLHNLAVIGGPVEIGEAVSVDFTTPDPTIVATAKDWLSIEDILRALGKLPEPLMLESLVEFDKIVTFCIDDPTQFFFFEPSVWGFYDGLQVILDDREDLGYARRWGLRFPANYNAGALGSFDGSLYDLEFWTPMYVWGAGKTQTHVRCTDVYCSYGVYVENIYFDFWREEEPAYVNTGVRSIGWVWNDPPVPIEGNPIYSPGNNYLLLPDQVFNGQIFRNCKFRIGCGDFWYNSGQTPEDQYYQFSCIHLWPDFDGYYWQRSADDVMIFENCEFHTRDSHEPKLVTWPSEWDDGYTTHIYLYDCRVDALDKPIPTLRDTGKLYSVGTQWIGVPNILDLPKHEILKISDRAALDHIHGSSGSSGGYDENALHDNELGEIYMVTEKTDPVGADLLLIEDSEASYAKKKIQISNLPFSSGSGTSGSGGGASTFLDLTDTPSAYTGQGGKLVSVKNTVDGLEFVDAPTGGSGGGDMYKSTYDTNDDGKVNSADAADAVPWSGVSSKPDPLDATAIHDNVAAEISAITEKASPVSADIILIEDSEASNAKKKVQIGNLPTGSSGSPGADIGAKVYNSANFTTTNGGNEAITFDSEYYDTDGIHSTVTNTGRLTCQTAGTYLVIGHVTWTANANNTRRLGIRKNGTTALGYQSNQPDQAVSQHQSVAVVTHMDVGDYVELLGYQDSGGDLDIVYLAGASPVFEMQKISSGGGDADAIHDNVSAEISAVTEKTSPVGADLILIEDSEASNAKKRVQIGNLPGSGTGTSGSAFIGTVLFDETAPSGDQSSFDIQNIPAGYDYLKIIMRGRTTYTGGPYDALSMIFNNDGTDANYRYERHHALSTPTHTIEDGNIEYAGIIGATGNTNNIWQGEITIIGYDDTTFHKSWHGKHTIRDEELVGLSHWGGMWENTAAINRITLSPVQTADFAEGTRCLVIGYKNQAVPSGLVSDIGARVYLASDQTNIATSTTTAIDFDTEDYDTDNLWTSGSGSRFTINTAGKYHIWGSVQWESNVDNARTVYIRKNGSVDIAWERDGGSSTGDVKKMGVSTIIDLEIGDYVELTVRHTAGVALDIQASGITTAFAIQKISSGGGDADAIHDNVAGEISALTEKTVPVGADLVLIEDSEASNAKKKVQISKFADVGVVNGRLTLESGVPISTDNQSAKTTLYFTPYMGNNIGLFTSGSVGYVRDFSELSLSLTSGSASTPYDIFIYDNAGTLTLEMLAWTDGTTRATAIVLHNGIYVKSGDVTRRYLGTIYINSSGGQTDDNVAKRFVWNYYNRVARTLYKATYSPHGYSTAAERPWNNDTTERIQYIIGLELEEPVMHIRLDNQINSTVFRESGIAIDNTTNSNSVLQVEYSQLRNNTTNQYHAHGPVLHSAAGLGFHYLQAMEYGSGTITFNAYYMDGQLWC